LDQTANTGQGLVLVGAHFGAHLAAVHWLYRRGIPLRLLVQRPRHISRYLSKEFDRADTHNPQADLFVKRHLPPRESAARVVRAWRALRDGMAVYFNSDIPWPIASARPGRFLGLGQRFLALWADLAALAQAPVLAVFCSYRPGGGFDLSFEGPWRVRPGAENHALQQFLDRLEARIITHPEQAVPYLFWPNYAVQRALKGDPPGVPSRTPNRAHSPRGLISKPVGSEAPTRTP
jgi:lauroyl/myristoyl acyltransferase